MKKSGILLLALAIGTSSMAQKVDLDKFNFQASFRGLPQKPLDSSYHTYSFFVATTPSIKANVPDEQMKNWVSIDGWKPVDALGHIIINIYMDDLTIESVNIKSREETIKDKDGKVTGKKYYYSAQATYSWAGHAYVKDYKGNDVMTKWEFAERGGKHNWYSTEYENAQAASDYYNNNRNDIKNSLIRSHVGNALNSIKNHLNVNYGYRKVTDQDFLWIVDSKKHPEYEAQKANWANFKEAMKMMNEKDELTPVREKLKPTIAYFDSLKTRFTGTDKADKKLRYGAYYCLAKIYLLLDEPDAAIREADGLIANEYDENDGKKLKKEAEELKKSFAANHVSSRHFTIDTSNYLPPSR